MNTQPSQAQSAVYQIKVAGHLDLAWSAWFDELTLTHEPDDTTVLTSVLIDQAALHGVLIKIRDLGLTLIAVQRIETDQ